MKFPVTLFVGNINPKIEKAPIKGFLSSLGNLSPIQIPIEVKKTTSGHVNKGYAYLKCQNEATYNLLLQTPMYMFGHEMKIREILSAERIVELFTLDRLERFYFLRGIPHFVSNKDLLLKFSKYAPVRFAAAIRPTKKDRSQFYGFVEFCSQVVLTESNIAKLRAELKFRDCVTLEDLPSFLKLEISQIPSRGLNLNPQQSQPPMIDNDLQPTPIKRRKSKSIPSYTCYNKFDDKNLRCNTPSTIRIAWHQDWINHALRSLHQRRIKQKMRR